MKRESSLLAARIHLHSLVNKKWMTLKSITIDYQKEKIFFYLAIISANAKKKNCKHQQRQQQSILYEYISIITIFKTNIYIYEDFDHCHQFFFIVTKIHDVDYDEKDKIKFGNIFV